MSLHMIKLCVGCDSIQDLEEWVEQKLKEKKRKGQKAEHIHTTRMVPKRAEELTDGGSLYWVIKGLISCREKILDIRPFVDKDGIGRCRVVLDGKIVPVEPRPYRAFQGWRYFEIKDAPRDLGRAAPGLSKMPEHLRRELRELGLL
ncbi:MAG: DUF1489 domain-containing protein [Pseudolabrys sp.]|nr:DUF1489 domain-containing protein [Pseudolabrys sp.]